MSYTFGPEVEGGDDLPSELDTLPAGCYKLEVTHGGERGEIIEYVAQSGDFHTTRP
jgi:hypothetical protein